MSKKIMVFISIITISCAHLGNRHSEATHRNLIFDSYTHKKPIEIHLKNYTSNFIIIGIVTSYAHGEPNFSILSDGKTQVFAINEILRIKEPKENLSDEKIKKQGMVLLFGLIGFSIFQYLLRSGKL